MQNELETKALAIKNKIEAFINSTDKRASLFLERGEGKTTALIRSCLRLLPENETAYLVGSNYQMCRYLYSRLTHILFEDDAQIVCRSDQLIVQTGNRIIKVRTPESCVEQTTMAGATFLGFDEIDPDFVQQILEMNRRDPRITYVRSVSS